MATNKKSAVAKTSSKSGSKATKSGGGTGKVRGSAGKGASKGGADAKKKLAGKVAQTKDLSKISVKKSSGGKQALKSASGKQTSEVGSTKAKAKSVKLTPSPKQSEKAATQAAKKGGIGQAIKGAVDVVAKRVSEAVSGGPTPKSKSDKKGKKTQSAPTAKSSESKKSVAKSSEPKMTSTKSSEPKMTSSKSSEPKMTSTKSSEPKMTSTKSSEPKMTSSKSSELKKSSSKSSSEVKAGSSKSPVGKSSKSSGKVDQKSPSKKGSGSGEALASQKQAESGSKGGAAAPVGTVTTTIKPHETPKEVVLTDAEGRRYCRVRECDQIAMVDTYCRYHYLLNWKKIQVRKRILANGKLRSYLEELTSRYPDKYLEMIHRDLRTDDDFIAAINELGIDESGFDTEYEDEAQTYIQEVRGVGESSGARDDDEY